MDFTFYTYCWGGTCDFNFLFFFGGGGGSGSGRLGWFESCVGLFFGLFCWTWWAMRRNEKKKKNPKIIGVHNPNI